MLIHRISSGLRDARARRLVLAAAVLAIVSLAGRPARAQEPVHEQPSAAAHEGAEGQAHEQSIWPFVGKIFNFVVLVGGLVYLMRKPFAEYLTRRGGELRAELSAAEALKAEATAKIAEIDARMKTLPAELEALGARGRADIAAEEQRIRELAATEKQRAPRSGRARNRSARASREARAPRARRRSDDRRRAREDPERDHRRGPLASGRSVSLAGDVT